MRSAATTTIRERLECLADVLAIDDPVSNRHVVYALGAVASLEQLVEAAQEIAYEGVDDLDPRLSYVIVRIKRGNLAALAAALAAVGPGEEAAQ